LHRVLKGVLVGGLVGGVVGAVKLATQPPREPTMADANGTGPGAPRYDGIRQVVLRAVEGALVGGAVGFLLDVRARRRAARAAALAPTLLRYAQRLTPAAAGAADWTSALAADVAAAARPHLERAAGTALGYAGDVAGAAGRRLIEGREAVAALRSA
jgi:hypothetical protein